MGEDYRNIAKDIAKNCRNIAKYFNIANLDQKPILILNPLLPKLIPLKLKWL